jgi:hypothetical protein
MPADALGHFFIETLSGSDIDPRMREGGGPSNGQSGFSTAGRTADEGQAGLSIYLGIYLGVQNKKSLSSISELKDGTQLT